MMLILIDNLQFSSFSSDKEVSNDYPKTLYLSARLEKKYRLAQKAQLPFYLVAIATIKNHDTIKYKVFDAVELNKGTRKNEIEKIDYYTLACFEQKGKNLSIKRVEKPNKCESADILNSLNIDKVVGAFDYNKILEGDSKSYQEIQQTILSEFKELQKAYESFSNSLSDDNLLQMAKLDNSFQALPSIVSPLVKDEINEFELECEYLSRQIALLEKTFPKSKSRKTPHKSIK